MIWRKNMPETTKNKVRGFFLSYGHVGTPEAIAEARDVLSRTSGGMEVWRASSNHQLIPIRQLELAKQRTQLQQRPGLSDDERKERLAEIEKQTEELDMLIDLLERGL